MIYNRNHIIRKWIFEEIDAKILVEREYPDIQWNEFEYKYPFKEGGLPDYDKIGIMGSTIYNDKLFYEYVVLESEFFDHKDDVILKMKNKIDESILKYIKYEQ